MLHSIFFSSIGTYESRTFFFIYVGSAWGIEGSSERELKLNVIKDMELIIKNSHEVYRLYDIPKFE